MCTAQPYANSPEDPTLASPGGALHPNELGHLAMAASLIAAIGGSELADPAGDPPPATPVPRSPPVLTPSERAAVRWLAQALLERLRSDMGSSLGSTRWPWAG